MQKIQPHFSWQVERHSCWSR